MPGRTLRLQLDLEVCGHELDGRLGPVGGPSATFSGWVGMLAALDALIAGATGDEHAADPRRDSGGPSV